MSNPIARSAWWVIVASVWHLAACAGWTYDEGEWSQECKEGSKQSPIALSSDIAQHAVFSSLIFEQYEETFPVLSKNNGHSVEIKLQVENPPQVKGGGLPHVYVLDNIHFHWESEHTMSDVRFPLEVHMVHYANSFPNVSEALKHTGGVAVLGVLFYLSPDNDVPFEPLIAVIDKIQSQVDTVQEMHFKVSDFLPRDKAGFYRYNGSLTTPPCTEGVIWTVFTNKLPISQSQVKAFPLVKTDHGDQLKKNYRSLQKLNGRRLLLRPSPIDSASSLKTIDMSCKILLVCLFFKKFV